jgi:hypothetical protein
MELQGEMRAQTAIRAARDQDSALSGHFGDSLGNERVWYVAQAAAL